MDLRVSDDLWATSMLPEGLFERWRVRDGQRVEAGDVLAEVLIEGALHEIIAPCAAWVMQRVGAGDIIEPGSLLAQLQDQERLGKTPLGHL